jgi:hypothetical protein
VLLDECETTIQSDALSFRRQLSGEYDPGTNVAERNPPQYAGWPMKTQFGARVSKKIVRPPPGSVAEWARLVDHILLVFGRGQPNSSRNSKRFGFDLARSD